MLVLMKRAAGANETRGKLESVLFAMISDDFLSLNTFLDTVLDTFLDTHSR
jgi:hypothetical protein